MDPRGKASKKELQLQHDLSVMCYNNIQNCMKALKGLEGNSVKEKAFSKFLSAFTSLHTALQESDWPPTTQMVNDVKKTQAEYELFCKNLK
jgi:hypothetical protein